MIYGQQEEDLPEDPYADSTDRDQYIQEIMAAEVLEKRNRRAADIILDIQDRGPLYHFLSDRRAHAIQALLSLIDIDPRDSVSIARLQAEARSWTDAVDWMSTRLEEADDAKLEPEDIEDA